METLRQVLMNSSAEDLAVLASYILIYNRDEKEKKQDSFQDWEKRYVYVSELVSGFQPIGRNYFYAKMEYGDIVGKLVETMEIELEKKSQGCIENMETAVAKKYIVKNLEFMPCEAKAELAQILGLSPEKGTGDKAIISGLSAELPENVVFRVLSWLSAMTAGVFFGRLEPWESKGLLFFGRKEFRRHVIYPVLYIAMLRHKYRYNRTPKCGTCKAAILPGAKFCSECGAKLF